MLGAFVAWIVDTVGKLGYTGIVVMMFLESSFFPFPSEVVVPPAGYLAAKGEMDIYMVIATGILGSLLGALFNYWIAVRYGRPFFERYGKYFLVSPEALDKADVFFSKHGHISTFVGRLVPVIRQYVSLPAGVARMNLPLFCFYTSLGAGIWVVILALAGYWMGSNHELVVQFLHKWTFVALGACALLVAGYIWHHRRKAKATFVQEQE